jgi:hypothetical protein
MPRLSMTLQLWGPMHTELLGVVKTLVAGSFCTLLLSNSSAVGQTLEQTAAYILAGGSI